MGKGLGLILLLLAADIVSKAMAVRELLCGGISVIKNFFSLDLAFNTGVAWGFFEGYATLWFCIRLVLIAGLIFYMLRRHPRWEFYSLCLILAGALGNTLDYLLYGKVVDFLHFTFWGHSFPVFNIADSCVTIGAIGLILAPKCKHQSG